MNTSNVIKKRQQTTIQKKSKTYYKVITGTFKNKNYAENLITKLKKSGFDGFYKIKSSSTGSKLYRVQAGSFFRKSDVVVLPRLFIVSSIRLSDRMCLHRPRSAQV